MVIFRVTRAQKLSPIFFYPYFISKGMNDSVRTIVGFYSVTQGGLKHCDQFRIKIDNNCIMKF